MNTRKGFTLVELLVVIAILAILATVSVVGYTSFINRAEDSTIETELHQIETTINSYDISKQEYVIATKTTGTPAVTTKYYAVVDATAKTVTVCTKSVDAQGKVTYTAVTSLEGLTWTDFEDVKTGFTLETGTNNLVYRGKVVDLND